jgi:hypothetical protein
MKPSDVLLALDTIKLKLAGPILAGTAEHVLDDAISQVKPYARQCIKYPERWVRGPWGFSINPKMPLEFKDGAVRGYRVRLDLSCEFRWPADPQGEPLTQNLVLRVWCLDPRLVFRAQWDAEPLKEWLTSGKRVVLRYHFDLASPEQPGPTYHVQVGGIPHGNECFWVPSEMNLPRLAHPPTDLLLACEMVAANFFPEDYRVIRRDGLWRGRIRESQSLVLGNYFRRCVQAVGNQGAPQSLLDELWHVPWN